MIYLSKIQVHTVFTYDQLLSMQKGTLSQFWSLFDAHWIPACLNSPTMHFNWIWSLAKTFLKPVFHLLQKFHGGLDSVAEIITQ